MTISMDRNDYKHWTKVVPRYSDQDPLAHINNVAIGSYLEVGRLHLLKGILDECAGTTTALVLARMTVDYRGEMKYPDVVEIGCTMVKVGGKSLTSHYALFQNDTCCAVSEAVNVFFDLESRRASEPPAAIRELAQSLVA